MYQKLEFEMDALSWFTALIHKNVLGVKEKKNQIKNHFNSSVKMENKIK